MTLALMQLIRLWSILYSSIGEKIFISLRFTKGGTFAIKGGFHGIPEGHYHMTPFIKRRSEYFHQAICLNGLSPMIGGVFGGGLAANN